MVSARDRGVWPGAAALVVSMSIATTLLTVSAAPAAAQANNSAQAQSAAPGPAQASPPAGTQSTAPAAPQMPAVAAVQTAPAKDQNPLGATVYSKDGQLAGAVDQMAGDQVVIGLAGYLGQGEKDVAIPAKGLQVAASEDVPRRFPNAQYGGGNITRITVPMTLSQLVAAPAYKQPAAQTGVPSPHVGTPAETKKKPPSSTQSGGPG
jgi:hypothetical protein